MVKLRKRKVRISRSTKLARLECGSVIQVHVNATFNNTHLTITDTNGDTIIWASSGSGGFRGKQKKTPYAARRCLATLLAEVRARRVRRSELIFRGVGPGRRGVARVLRRFGFRFLSIRDNTPIPHNGCRLRKKRRKRVRGQKIRKWRCIKLPVQIRRPRDYSRETGRRRRREPLKTSKKSVLLNKQVVQGALTWTLGQYDDWLKKKRKRRQKEVLRYRQHYAAFRAQFERQLSRI